tara:strand:- start:225 stop:1079 length:855 start_codon:yes stop_codon:yes gene_type:complete
MAKTKPLNFEYKTDSPTQSRPKIRFNLTVYPKVRKENNDILLSFPHSGNTFTRYFLEIVTRRPTWGYFMVQLDPYTNEVLSAEGDGLDGPLLLLTPDNNFPWIDREGFFYGKPIFKRHIVESDKNIGDWPFDPEKDNIIMILRNPRELFYREYTVRTLRGESNVFQNFFPEYFSNLKYYKSHTGKKIILRFEDLKNNPQKFFGDLGKFVNAEESLVNSFIENIDFFRAQSFDLYDFIHNKTIKSQRKNMEYYENRVPDFIKTWADEEINKNIDLYKEFFEDKSK